MLKSIGEEHPMSIAPAVLKRSLSTQCLRTDYQENVAGEDTDEFI
jgi:hypothetical protein